MSGERKFTSGPWTFESEKPDTVNRGMAVTAANGDPDDPIIIATIWGTEVDREFDKAGIANAHLIAAAPELYDALEAMCHGTDDMLEWAALVQRGREALRKARGESQ